MFNKILLVFYDTDVANLLVLSLKCLAEEKIFLSHKIYMEFFCKESFQAIFLLLRVWEEEKVISIETDVYWFAAVGGWRGVGCM